MRFTADFVDNDGTVTRVAERAVADDGPRYGQPPPVDPLADVLRALDAMADDYPRSVRAVRRLIADNPDACEIIAYLSHECQSGATAPDGHTAGNDAAWLAHERSE